MNSVAAIIAPSTTFGTPSPPGCWRIVRVRRSPGLTDRGWMWAEAPHKFALKRDGYRMAHSKGFSFRRRLELDYDSAERYCTHRDQAQTSCQTPIRRSGFAPTRRTRGARKLASAQFELKTDVLQEPVIIGRDAQSQSDPLGGVRSRRRFKENRQGGDPLHPGRGLLWVANSLE
jgi:hypothetical protein